MMQHPAYSYLMRLLAKHKVVVNKNRLVVSTHTDVFKYVVNSRRVEVHMRDFFPVPPISFTRQVELHTPLTLLTRTSPDVEAHMRSCGFEFCSPRSHHIRCLPDYRPAPSQDILSDLLSTSTALCLFGQDLPLLAAGIAARTGFETSEVLSALYRLAHARLVDIQNKKVVGVNSRALLEAMEARIPARVRGTWQSFNPAPQLSPGSAAMSACRHIHDAVVSIATGDFAVVWSRDVNRLSQSPLLVPCTQEAPGSIWVGQPAPMLDPFLECVLVGGVLFTSRIVKALDTRSFFGLTVAHDLMLRDGL